MYEVCFQGKQNYSSSDKTMSNHGHYGFIHSLFPLCCAVILSIGLQLIIIFLLGESADYILIKKNQRQAAHCHNQRAVNKWSSVIFAWKMNETIIKIVSKCLSVNQLIVSGVIIMQIKPAELNG